MGVEVGRAGGNTTNARLCSSRKHGEDVLTLQFNFREPHTKLWLFDTIVTSTLLYVYRFWDQALIIKATLKELMKDGELWKSH